ncbi:tetraspanin-8-like [Labrus mixtus]|uniref:tetraspanin-8-like n=1 Tax=Labrus mixtus TaxID=508554 RepID=UPI0029C0D56D|nr:tetraspanin-8-like [Labrus mixtus]
MGRVSVWLKRSYIIVTSLIAIIGVLLLAITLFSHIYLRKDEEIETMLTGFYGMYVHALIPLLLSIIGVYGVCKQKKWALIVSAVGMILCSLYLIVSEIGVLAVQPELSEDLRMRYLSLLPLSNATEGDLKAVHGIEKHLQCCGLDRGYLDWGNNITESCLCTEWSINPCVALPMNSINLQSAGVQPVMIFKEPCIPHLIAHQMVVLYSCFGVMLGITLLLLLSVVLCIVILCRLDQKDDTPTVVYSPEANAGNYIILADAAANT